MYESCLEKQSQVKEMFEVCRTEEDKYEKIIELGKENRSLPQEYRVPENLVSGCQSIMYLRSYLQGDKVYFEGESDALISSGLAVILIKGYSGETPEAILKCEPLYLEELGLSASLTPSRANGLYSIYLRMKQDALKYLMQSS